MNNPRDTNFDFEKETSSMSHFRVLAVLALAGAFLIAPGSKSGAVPVSPGLSRIHGLSAIEFVQDRPKSETVKQ